MLKYKMLLTRLHIELKQVYFDSNSTTFWSTLYYGYKYFIFVLVIIYFSLHFS